MRTNTAKKGKISLMNLLIIIDLAILLQFEFKEADFQSSHDTRHRPHNKITNAQQLTSFERERERNGREPPKTGGLPLVLSLFVNKITI